MEYVTTETPIRISDLTLIPVVHVSLKSTRKQYSYYLSAEKEALAIIICNRNSIRVIDVNSDEIEISKLHEKIPELRKLLEACNH